MWLNTIRTGKKKLSPQELLVMASLGADFIPASKILETTKNQTSYWQPEAGVIYPILHRLSDFDLLEKRDESDLEFRLSPKGFNLFSSSFSSFAVQFYESLDFYEVISKTLIEIDPILAKEYLDEIKNRLEQSLEQVHALQDYAATQIKEDSWNDVDVEF